MNLHRFTYFVCVALIGAMVSLMPLQPSVAAPKTAPKPPYDGCVAVTRQEYNAARKEHLLRTRFTQYMRTGLPARRQYWYCR